MPLDLFEIEGFAVWVAEDVTITESIDAIKRILLRQDECDTGIIKDLKAAVHALVGLNEVKVGLMPFVKINDQFVLDEGCTVHSIIGKNWRAGDPGREAISFILCATVMDCWAYWNLLLLFLIFLRMK